MIRQLVLAGMLGSACLDIAGERAQRDLEVGKAEAAQNRIEIRDGLGAVRRLEAGSLEIWANAPALEATLELGDEAPESFTVLVRNALPDAELDVEDASGTQVSTTPVPGEVATEKRFSLRTQPNTRYSLRLGPSDLESRQPFEFIALADVQEAIDRVEDVFEKMNERAGARFAMFSGDITSRGKTSELEEFQRKMQRLSLPLFTTLGNHELGNSDVPYHDYFGRGSESFRFHCVRFTFLDSASAAIDAQVYEWLEDWLDAARNENHLVFMHVPPIDPFGIRNGAFSSRAEAAKLLSLLGRGRVDITFYGHIHSYYAFENAGIPAYISGGGGAIPERFDGIGRHFLAVTVDPERDGASVSVVRVD
jgi:3',5'-cyclic-AMP phosphodiesterase